MNENNRMDLYDACVRIAVRIGLLQEKGARLCTDICKHADKLTGQLTHKESVNLPHS